MEKIKKEPSIISRNRRVRTLQTCPQKATPHQLRKVVKNGGSPQKLFQLQLISDQEKTH